MPVNNMGSSYAGPPSPEVKDFEVIRNFILEVNGKDCRVATTQAVEVLFDGGRPQKFRCPATKGKWTDFDQVTLGYLNSHMKEVVPVKSPEPVEDVVTYIATDNFTLIKGYPVAKGRYVEVEMRNGVPRAARHDPADLWHVCPDELKARIEGHFLVVLPEDDSEPDMDNPVHFEVIKDLEIGGREFNVGDEVWTDGTYIKHPSGHYEKLDVPFVAYMDHFKQIPLEPDEPLPEEPDLSGEPLEIALAILPTLREVFHWVPGHDWNMTAPMEANNPKVAVGVKLDYKWSMEIIFDTDEAVATLTEDTFTGGDGYKERSRAILNSHSWSDFVGWISEAAGLATHPIKAKGEKFVTTEPVEIEDSRWGPGQIIHVLNDKIDDRVRELVASGALVSFYEGQIFNCEGCWKASRGCTKSERWGEGKCEEWTLEEPPPEPPKQRYLSVCKGCENRIDATKDKWGNTIEQCREGCDPYSTDECLHWEIKDDIPF